MADIISREQRHKNMVAIKSKDTRPEIYFRKALFKNGFRYRKNVSCIFGHPDIFLAKYKTAIFVNGCFWHRHAHCKMAYMPKSNVEFWNKKFQQNIERDRKVKEVLIHSGIKCLIVWGCTIQKMMADQSKEKEIILTTNTFLYSHGVYMEL